MKYALVRILTLSAFAMVLGFVSEAELKVTEGQAFVVGRCQVAYNGVTSELLKSENCKHLKSENVVGIAQAKLKDYKNGKPVYQIKKIFKVKTDKNGVFMMKSVPSNCAYLFLGAQIHENIPLKLDGLVYSKNINSNVVNLGENQISVSLANSGKNVELEHKVFSKFSNEAYIQHFLNKSWLHRFAQVICGPQKNLDQNKGVEFLKASEVEFDGLDTVEWVTIES